MFRWLASIACMAAGLILPSAGWSSNPVKRVDLYDDPLPAGAIARLGSIRFHHPGGISAMAFSPDGKVIIAAGSGKAGETFRVWETASGKELVRFGEAEDYHFPGLTFTPDGKAVAIGHKRLVKLYDWRTGKLLRSLGPYRSVFAFSPDGKLLVADSAKEPAKAFDERPKHFIRVWDVATGRELPAFALGTNAVHTLGFSADGKRLLCRTTPEPDPRSAISAKFDEAGFIGIWDMASRTRLHQYACPTSNVVFSSDGNTIAFQPGDRFGGRGAGFRAIEIVNAATGKTLRKIASEGASLGFTPDGKSLVAITEKEISLWDPATGKRIRKMRGHVTTELPRLVGFSADGKVLAVASGGWMQDGLIRLWNLATAEELRIGGGHQDEVTCLAYAPDGKLFASGSRDRTIRFWDPATSREVRCLEGHDSDVLALAFSPDGKTLASSSADGATRLWDVRGGRELARLDGPSGREVRLVFAADGKTLIAATQAGKSQVWELPAGKSIRRHELGGKNPILLALTPDADTFLASEHLDYEDKAPDLLRLVSLTTLKPVRVMPLNPCRHPNTRFLCVGAAVSADGKRIASWQTVLSSNHPLPTDHGAALQVWERATGQEVFKVMFTYFDALTFSRDGRLILGSHSTSNTDWRMCRGGLSVFDAWTGARLGTLPGHAALVGALAFSPDGKTLASASGDHTILLWKNDVPLAVKPAKAEPSAKQLDAWWEALGNNNAALAHRALAEVVAHPAQAVRLTAERLRPAPPVDVEQIARLIKDLDSADFKTRQQASAAIEKLETADMALRHALASNPPLEVRRRLELVLEKVELAPLPPARLRSHRAITALQWIDSPAARQTLEKLAEGAPQARQTQEARDALKHLAGLKANP
ncbi:MAG: WD40 repeat domain-containing protein [Planctomycetes bacterium]|nr:WD40 repeat domain-containing protein [Planctomycetota bacterium]